jgi:septum formation protein
MSPLAEARRAARLKAEQIAGRFPGLVVVGADTVVALNGRSLGKPRDRAHAREILGQLSGRTHLVYTAVHVIDGRTGRQVGGYSRTFVSMRRVSPAQIDRYAASQEVQDKAGAYAIQGEGASLVRSIRGPRDNVVGMPVTLLRRLLAELAPKS